ncbi:PD-(D/E)XK nuclease family protein [Flagellimonas meridianipacifica]|uniref:PD-(D/E)XK nuclease superfamily protein n=1 Tax=Flagellimonas meridianipacifica TaxID=1080225 RepID=A0A2T0MGS6_9FLAO|nr:PD-(D/E)XK nuclease family protein [Allomuricauda pacifica]PRX56778.1 PD-(D/E)XK nuclease superfamily protein [Allomuricauda pacifica]
MHQSFIEFVLQDLTKNGSSIEHNTYILPSKRSGVFLKHHLSEILNKNIFTPPISSIEDFVQEVSGLKKASNIELLLILYESYKTLPIKDLDDFDTFLKWGETILQDFNEIDRYLLPANEILNYLKSIKELDHWSLQPKKTRLVKEYLDFWENIESLYHDFSKRLITKKIAHQGLIYRIAAQNIAKYTEENIKSPIVFLGFNALNSAESEIIQHLLAHTECEVYWDIDLYFLDDPIHDAGLFIRRYISEWPYYVKNNPKGIHNRFLSDKTIEITGVPKSVSQTKYVGEILKERAAIKSASSDNLAVVLADESLLFPMTKAVPTEIENINITMGISLKNTLLYSLFVSVFELVEDTTNKGWFYKNVLNLLSNPYFKIISEDSKVHFSDNIIQSLKTNNTTYVQPKALSLYLAQYDIDPNLFPDEAMVPNSIIEYCLFIISRLKEIFQKEKNAVELQYVYTFYNLFHQLKTQINAIGFIKNIKTVHSFFKQLATTESIDFIGSPIGGLQLMGVLESRTLDFETVIITSVNEGILPAGKNNSSFIPFDVKREYGLPTYKEKDAIYTYHFYRLIQRAKNVYIIYNTEPDVLEGGERSRLISQLLTDHNLKSVVSHKIATPRIHIEPQNKEQITKTSLLLSSLEALGSKGYSPTSLSNYIRNPIDFYKKHVLQLPDSIEIQESIAANTFGTIIHEALFLLYQPYLGTILNKESITLIRSHIRPTIKKSFSTHLPSADTEKGRYLLIFHVIERYIQNFIKMESQLVEKHQIKLLHLEERFETTLNFNEISHPITLKGFIDRIDEFDGTIRVIDYKTGNTESRDVRIKEWEELILNDKKSKAFQLLCYAYLLNKHNGSSTVTAGIYAIKNLKNGLLQFSFNNNPIINESVLEEFQNQLKALIMEIYNPEIPFTDKN